MHQPVQPKSLSWCGEVDNSLIFQQCRTPIELQRDRTVYLLWIIPSVWASRQPRPSPAGVHRPPPGFKTQQLHLSPQPYPLLTLSLPSSPFLHRMLPGKGMHTCISHLNISYGSLILSLLMLNAYCIYGLQNRIFKKNSIKNVDAHSFGRIWCNSLKH